MKQLTASQHMLKFLIEKSNKQTNKAAVEETKLDDDSAVKPHGGREKDSTVQKVKKKSVKTFLSSSWTEERGNGCRRSCRQEGSLLKRRMKERE